MANSQRWGFQPFVCSRGHHGKLLHKRAFQETIARHSTRARGLNNLVCPNRSTPNIDPKILYPGKYQRKARGSPGQLDAGGTPNESKPMSWGSKYVNNTYTLGPKVNPAYIGLIGSLGMVRRQMLLANKGGPPRSTHGIKAYFLRCFGTLYFLLGLALLLTHCS